MDYTEELAKLTKGHSGFARYGNKFAYETMGIEILIVYTTPPRECNDRPSSLMLHDNRAGKHSTNNYQEIVNTINYFKKQPYQNSARAVFTVNPRTFYVGDKVCVIMQNNNVVDVIWEGQQFDLRGVTAQYSFETAVAMLTLYRTGLNSLVSNFAQIFGDHPDFYILERGVYLRSGDQIDYYVARMDDGGWVAWDMFRGGHTGYITYDRACDELRKLMLALNPPLICGERVSISNNITAYPHMLFDRCKIIAHGDLYNKKPYSFEQYADRE